MLMDYFDAFAARYQPYKGGTWCYEDGCIYRGLQLLHEATGEDRWLAHLLRLATAQVAEDGSLKGYAIDEYNIDNILSGRVLFYLADKTDDPRWMKAADLLARQLSTHPRIGAGGYWHKKIYPHQVWLDGLYMALPFQFEYAQRRGDSRMAADALDQLFSALEHTDAGNGLYVHGYDESRAQAWADDATGRSPACWARALGWLAMAMADLIALAGPEADTTLVARTETLLRRIAHLQMPDGGWLQVIDQPDLPGNYTESSSTAMFVYAFLRVVRLGLAQELRGPATRGLDFLQARLQPQDGVVQLGGICHVAGLGGFSDVYRDGTPAYYLTEKIVADDSKGTGPLMMAGAEAVLADLVPVPA